MEPINRCLITLWLRPYWSSSVEVTRQRTARHATRWWAIRTASARGRSMTARSWDTQSNHRRRGRAAPWSRPADCARGEVMQFQHFSFEWNRLRGDRTSAIDAASRWLWRVLFSLLSNSAVSYIYHLTFSSRRRQLMSKTFNRLQSRIVKFHVPEPYSNTVRGDQSTVHSYLCLSGDAAAFP